MTYIMDDYENMKDYATEREARRDNAMDGMSRLRGALQAIDSLTEINMDCYADPIDRLKHELTNLEMLRTILRDELAQHFTD